MNKQEIQILQDKFVKRKIHGVLIRKWGKQHERDKPQYKKERRWK